MPFLDHLEELRWRILWSGIAIIVGSVIGFCFVYYLDIIEHLIAPIRAAYGSEEGWSLIYLSPADPFFITLKLARIVIATMACRRLERRKSGVTRPRTERIITTTGSSKTAPKSTKPR